MDSRPKLPPVVELYPYQKIWVDDHAPFKGAVKSARTGFTFGCAVDDALNCLEIPGSTWLYTSAGDDQVIEYFEKGIGTIKEAMQFTAEIYKEPFADELGKTDLIQHRCNFANGSRIIGRPCNPRTARGFPGNATFDEFAHVELSYQIFAAVGRGLARGGRLRMLSTPNGEQGKFFDLAKGVGFAEGVEPTVNPLRAGAWSWHWLDINMAIAQGCPISIEAMRELFKGDDDAFAQEFLCRFLKAAGAWLSLELVSAAEDDGATVDLPPAFMPEGFLSLGVDFGRSGDRSCLWLDEHLGDVSWARAVEWKFNTPFFAPDGKDQVHWLEPFVEMADRVAMDATGMGLPLYEYFNTKHPGKVMGVNFGGSVKRMHQGDSETRARSGLAESVKIKTDMALRMKRRMEQRLNRIPRNMDIRNELLAIKREQTSNAVTFDAPRIEVDTAAGQKKKVFSHAEAFWAKAMADLAAERNAQHMTDAFMAGQPRPQEFTFSPMRMGA